MSDACQIPRVAVLIATLAACTPLTGTNVPAPPARAAFDAPASAALLQEIRREIGTARCDADDQCRTVGVGAKPCGGPRSYLAWSAKQTDGARLAELVARQRAAQKAENERSGMLSDCRVLRDPGATCRPMPGRGQACEVGLDDLAS